MAGLVFGARGNFNADLQPSGGSAGVRRALTEVEEVQHEIERLLMITEALWTIMKEEHGYSDDELIERIALIDMRDGKLDGRVKKSGVLHCPNCGRTISKRHPKCLYCGTPVGVNPFER